MAERITLYKSENSIQSDIGLLKPDKLYRSADKKFWLMVEIGEYDGVCPILSADNFEHLDSLQDGTYHTLRSDGMALGAIQHNFEISNLNWDEFRSNTDPRELIAGLHKIINDLNERLERVENHLEM